MLVSVVCMYIRVFCMPNIENVLHFMYIHKYMYTVTGFTEFKAHYHTILRLLPDDYHMTAGKLVNYINDDQICAILSSNNPSIANKMILDCLIEKLSCAEELLDVCVQLENITASHDMRIVINKIRLGMYCYCVLVKLHNYTVIFY